MSENARSKIIGFIEDGLLDWEMVCRECLERMSVDDINDMIRECDWDDDHSCCCHSAFRSRLFHSADVYTTRTADLRWQVSQDAPSLGAY